MPTTFSDLIDRTLRWAPQEGQVDQLALAISTGSQLDTVTITPDDISKWGAPADAEIGSEVFHVVSVDRGAGSATALRGYHDTSTAAHAVDAVCRLNPRFFRKDVSDSIVDCLRRIVPPLYRIRTTDLTYASGTVGYALAADTIDVYRVWNETDSTAKAWREVFSFDVAHEMDTAKFTNGKGLILGEGGRQGPLRVLYKAAFTEPAAESDDMETNVGMQAFMLDIPVWYAVSVLVPPDEVLRTQPTSAVSSQRAEQTEQRSQVTVAEYFRARYEDAVREAAKRLDMLHPVRVRFIR